MTDIIMTMGPANHSKQKLIDCYQEGIRILRYNFPHYTQETVTRDLEIVHEVEQEVGGKFALLLDTEGPEIRTGYLETPIVYQAGDVFTITTQESQREPNGLFCDYPSLVDDVKIGGIVKIDAGLLDAQVIEK